MSAGGNGSSRTLTRHPAPRVHESRLPDLDRLHAAHVAASGPPLDVAQEVRDLVHNGRGRFVGGGGWSSNFEGSRLAALVHAAEHGYRLCSLPQSYGQCYFPAGHDGDCMGGHGWEWELLYGDKRPVRLACSRCNPHSTAPVPEDCPHANARSTPDGAA